MSDGSAQATQSPTPEKKSSPFRRRIPPFGQLISPARLENWRRGLVLTALTALVFLAGWQGMHNSLTPNIPGPLQTWNRAQELFANPFAQTGPNTAGIGIQVLYSLGRVAAGFGLAVLVGVPLGFLMGMLPTFRAMLEVIINLLKPVSPLAWLPIGLLMFRSATPSAIFVVFITCIWPTVINTAQGVASVPQDYLNVARVLRMGRWTTSLRILLPAAAPSMLTGMRLSLGVAWMVIVAAEMLTGGIGIGFFIWDEWNNLNVASILVAIGVIGVVGIVLDGVMSILQRRLAHPNR